MTEGEMVEWHHRFKGHELGQTLGDGQGQECLMCCSPQGCKESDIFNLLAEYIMRNAGLDEAQAGIKIAGANIN